MIIDQKNTVQAVRFKSARDSIKGSIHSLLINRVMTRGIKDSLRIHNLHLYKTRGIKKSLRIHNLHCSGSVVIIMT